MKASCSTVSINRLLDCSREVLLHMMSRITSNFCHMFLQMKGESILLMNLSQYSSYVVSFFEDSWPLFCFLKCIFSIDVLVKSIIIIWTATFRPKIVALFSICSEKSWDMYCLTMHVIGSCVIHYSIIWQIKWIKWNFPHIYNVPLIPSYTVFNCGNHIMAQNAGRHSYHPTRETATVV